MNRRPKGVTAQEAVALSGYGCTPRDIADALGIQIESVAAALTRAKQHDLASTFYAAAAAERERAREAA
jgi:DNA-binding CsgD family transcriptional regulator